MVPSCVLTGVSDNSQASRALRLAPPLAANSAESAASNTEGQAVTSFEAFFVEAWPYAARLAGLMTQNASVGEEMAQDVLARMYSSWDTIEQPFGYLRRGLVNAAHNQTRSERTSRLKLPLIASADHVDPDADHMADAIAALPIRQRTVIVLRYYADLSEADIAQALDCRPGTVKSLASRALAQLAKEIQP